MSIRRPALASLCLACVLVVLARGSGPAFAEDPAKASGSDLARRVEEATTHAAKELAREASLSPTEVQAAGHGGGRSSPMLVALALVRAGGHEEKKVAARLLDEWWERAKRSPGGNYELALAISALEGLSLERIHDAHPTTMARYEARKLEPKVQKRLAIATRALVAGRHVKNDKACAWFYDSAPFEGLPDGETLPDGEGLRDGTTSPKAKGRTTVTKTPPRPTPNAMRTRWEFDNSNTQFAVLALHDAKRGGIEIPGEVVEQIAAHFLECATSGIDPGRGRSVTPTGDDAPPVVPVHWGYLGQGPSSPAMHFAGLSSLAIARQLGAKDAQIEATLKRGLVPVPGYLASRDAYTLYSLEKALDIASIEKIDGKEWFPPLAEAVLAAQGKDGLWGDTVQSALFVLFLTRATVAGSRIVDRRTTGRVDSGSPGEVFLPGPRKSVDAIQLVRDYARSDGDASMASQALALLKGAGDAVRALAAEGHGRDACLLPALAELLAKGGERHDVAVEWLRLIAGRSLSKAELEAAAKKVEEILKAREDRCPEPLRSALADASSALPIRAIAAHGLATMPCPDAAPDLLAAADRLADDRASLETAAGARLARTYGDAIGALVRAALPALPQATPPSAADLSRLAGSARVALGQAVEGAVSRALEARATAERDPSAWQKARSELLAAGRPAVERLLVIAEDSPRAPAAFALLRAATGELIPDDLAAWKVHLAR